MEEIFAFTADMNAVADKKNAETRMIVKTITDVESFLASVSIDDTSEGRLPYGERFAEDDPSN